MPEDNINQQEQGLGSIDQSQASAPFMATQNSSLRMLDEKRKGDNVIQEKNTEVTLSGIREEAKQELASEMLQRNEMNNSLRSAEDNGYRTGLGDAMRISSPQVAQNQQVNQVPADNGMTYSEQYSEPAYDAQSEGLGNIN